MPNTNLTIDAEKLALVALHTSNSVVITNKAGEIEWVNPGFTELTEYHLDEVIGKKPGHILRGKDTRKEDILEINEKIESKDSFYHEILNYSKTGRKYWVNMYITPVYNNFGEVDNYISIQSDITQQKRDQEKLKAALKRSKESEEKLLQAIYEKDELSNNLMLAELKFKTTFKQEKNITESITKIKRELTDTQEQLAHNEKMASLGLLMAGIAHEMNNPLNFISNGISALQTLCDDMMEMFDEYTSEAEAKCSAETQKTLKDIRQKYDYEETVTDFKELTQDIENGANRTIEIVKGLRVFARTDDNEQTSVQLSELLNSTLILLKNKYKHRIKVEVNYEEGLKPIACYVGPLNQVLMNIINNAIQAIPEDRKDGQLTISLRKTAKGQLISIKDNGSGMSEEVKQKMFQPFFTTKPAGIGTGLGMSISRDIIINKHKGEITFLSEEGVGTEFLITIPE